MERKADELRKERNSSQARKLKNAYESMLIHEKDRINDKEIEIKL